MTITQGALVDLHSAPLRLGEYVFAPVVDAGIILNTPVGVVVLHDDKGDRATYDAGLEWGALRVPPVGLN